MQREHNVKKMAIKLNQWAQNCFAVVLNWRGLWWGAGSWIASLQLCEVRATDFLCWKPFRWWSGFSSPRWGSSNLVENYDLGRLINEYIALLPLFFNGEPIREVLSSWSLPADVRADPTERSLLQNSRERAEQLGSHHVGVRSSNVYKHVLKHYSCTFGS